MLARLVQIGHAFLQEVDRVDPETRERIFAALEKLAGDLGDFMHEVRHAIRELRRA